MSYWIDTASEKMLRGYIKKYEYTKERYFGKYGVGIRIKIHHDKMYYKEIIRTVYKDDQWFTAVFRRNIPGRDAYEYRAFTVLNIEKHNDGAYCKLGDGITGILKPEWELYKCDVWEVLGV